MMRSPNVGSQTNINDSGNRRRRSKERFFHHLAKIQERLRSEDVNTGSTIKNDEDKNVVATTKETTTYSAIPLHNEHIATARIVNQSSNSQNSQCNNNNSHHAPRTRTSTSHATATTTAVLKKTEFPTRDVVVLSPASSSRAIIDLCSPSPIQPKTHSVTAASQRPVATVSMPDEGAGNNNRNTRVANKISINIINNELEHIVPISSPPTVKKQEQLWSLSGGGVLQEVVCSQQASGRLPFDHCTTTTP
eukprot:GEZU01029533.1.p1 GENE.GEZU01029533.1~~GEZU01029533.1.p1  ORF type:complete len:249 (-),score=24.07 GEZU01029533.1:2-748(-)